jgi:putative tryptophan/tyrosine transport system substrate-binding protein
MTGMRRRDFVTLLGGAAAGWPVAAQAEPQMPVIGFLSSGSSDAFANRVRAFHSGLRESGYVEGENVTTLYRWAEGQNDRLPAQADELVRRRVALFATFGSIATLTAKKASAAIPIVFAMDEDPVRLGLVTSLSRPGGNLTGTNFLANEIVAKRLELLRDLVPTAKRVAVLVNPTYPGSETTLKEVPTAASVMGLQIDVLNASTSGQIDAVFASFMRDRPDALFVGGDPFFSVRRIHLVNLVSRHGLPSTFSTREFPDAGALMSYGTNIADSWRQAGVYAGRILKGAKPADLPVVQASKFEFVINAQTARMLGLTLPPALLSTADEVIE